MPAQFELEDEAIDAVFRVFEGDKAPAVPWTEEETERYEGQLRNIPVWQGEDGERKLTPEDVREGAY